MLSLAAGGLLASRGPPPTGYFCFVEKMNEHFQMLGFGKDSPELHVGLELIRSLIPCERRDFIVVD